MRRHWKNAGPPQEVLPAFCELTVGKKIVCKSGMGIHMIGIDFQGPSIIFLRFAVVPAMADSVADIT
jgi:hypothetical protein